LSIAAYLGSKFVVLGALTGIQAALFVGVATIGVPGPDAPLILGSDRAEVILAVLGVTWASMAIGLAVSAAIPNVDRGMPLLVLLIMAQLILCGGLFPVTGRPALEQLPGSHPHAGVTPQARQPSTFSRCLSPPTIRSGTTPSLTGSLTRSPSSD
jgi:hypothetical protein